MFLQAPSGHVIGFTWPLHPTIERQWRDGDLVRVAEDGSPYVEDTGPADDLGSGTDADHGDEEPVRPAGNAVKQVWVDYAVAIGLMTRDEAEATPKATLVEASTPPELKG